MDCTHSRFPTLAPHTIDELADTFDAETLAAMQRDLAPLVTADSPTAAAWKIATASLAEAHESRFYSDNPHLVGRRDRT